MPAIEPQAQPPRPFTLAGMSMSDLLASCAAAEAVSTPPRLPDPGTSTDPGISNQPVEHRRAA